MKARWIMSCVVLLCAAAAVGFILTEDNAQMAASGEVVVLKENEGYLDMESNPLLSDTYPELEDAVRKYYSERKEDTGFVEDYHNVQIYTKKGRYKDSYVVFVRYDMKIKDIYTEVPGLGTLYVEKNADSGEYQIDSAPEQEGIQELVNTLASHGDVQSLMAQIQTDYENAVASDALLAEALQDLKNAYENR